MINYPNYIDIVKKKRNTMLSPYNNVQLFSVSTKERENKRGQLL